MIKGAKALPDPEALFQEYQPRFTFGVQAVADACEISLRQLTWWTKVNYVPVINIGKRRRYNTNSIKIALLIKSGLSSGMSLRKAANRARELYPFLWENETPSGYLEDEEDETDGVEDLHLEVVELASELTDISKRIEVLLDIVNTLR